MIKNELNLAKEENKQCKTSLTDLDQTYKQLERKFKEKEWEFKDAISLKEAK